MSEPDGQGERNDRDGSWLGGEGVKIGRPGNWTPVIEYRVIEEEPRLPPVDWLPRAIWALIAAALLAALALAGYIWHEIATHIHHPAAPVASGKFAHAGYVFALVCVVAAAFIVIRAAARWLSGR